jgi:hypothetical protein
MWYLYTMEFYAALKRMKSYHSQVNGWYWVRLAWPKRPKIVCSPSHADIRSRANTTRELNFDHMIKWEHTREVWG